MSSSDISRTLAAVATVGGGLALVGLAAVLLDRAARAGKLAAVKFTATSELEAELAAAGNPKPQPHQYDASPYGKYQYRTALEAWTDEAKTLSRTRTDAAARGLEARVEEEQAALNQAVHERLLASRAAAAAHRHEVTPPVVPAAIASPFFGSGRQCSNRGAGWRCAKRATRVVNGSDLCETCPAPAPKGAGVAKQTEVTPPVAPPAVFPSDKAHQGAAKLVAETDLTPDRRLLLAELARRFDQESAFPKLSDIRNFLLEYQQSATDLKGRVGAFKRMLPVLAAMSPKGLEKLIARSHHSGPADLGAISDAIRSAGEDLRGGQQRGEAPHEVVPPVVPPMAADEAARREAKLSKATELRREANVNRRASQISSGLAQTQSETRKAAREAAKASKLFERAAVLFRELGFSDDASACEYDARVMQAASDSHKKHAERP